MAGYLNASDMTAVYHDASGKAEECYSEYHLISDKTAKTQSLWSEYDSVSDKAEEYQNSLGKVTDYHIVPDSPAEY
jgi:hypothetical protein